MARAWVVALLLFSRSFGVLGVTCNTGRSYNYTGTDCGTMTNEVNFTTAECSGNCYTESMKQEISKGVCDVIFVTVGCVVSGSNDCATLQAAYDAMDPAAGNYGFACEECSTASCNTPVPLSSTLSAVISHAMRSSSAVVIGLLYLSWS